MHLLTPHFTTTRRVQFAETDMAGIVHFANFYRWMEETEHEFFRSCGLTIMSAQEDGRYIGWPRVSASCSFERPARYEDLLEIRLQIERIGVKSLTFLVEFYNGAQRIAHGRMKTACCLCGHDLPLESIAIPGDYLARLPQLEG
ncbi:MAG: acyl-CoA thioesterase [Planctomycetaceae bacterium]|nr:acyl-CoA thioesterase [Planctomycetaceae bacterium]